MAITYIILFLSVLAWAITPLRQYRNNFYFIFLIMGIGDPFNSILYHGLKISWDYIFPVYSILIYFSVLYAIGKLEKKKVIFFSIVTIAVFFFSSTVIHYYLVIVSLLALQLYTMLMLTDAFKRSSLNISYLMFFLYQLLHVLKIYLLFYTNAEGRYNIFFLLSITEVVIAIYFIVIRIEKSPRINFLRKTA